MKQEWHSSESNKKPLSIDKTSSNEWVYVRKNIHLVTKEYDEETYEVFQYEEKRIAKADWLVYEDIFSNMGDISDNRQGIEETFETTLANADDIADVRTALEEVYEMISEEE